MSRLAVLLVLLCACSKAKDREAPSAPPPPAAGDAARAQAGDATAAVIDAAVPADAADAGGAAAGDGGAAGASDFDFDKLSHDDKVKFMKQKVMPAMKPLFRKFDPKHFAKVTCKTCHGKDPRAVEYKMPSKDLPALDFAAIEAGKADPQVIEFMSKTVKPAMAKLLNKPEMTETQPKGFGCLDCHTEKKKK